MTTYPEWPRYQLTEKTEAGGFEVRIATTTPDGLVHGTRLICQDLRQLEAFRTRAYEMLAYYVEARYPELFPRRLTPAEALEVLSLLGAFFPEQTVDIVRERLGS